MAGGDLKGRSHRILFAAESVKWEIVRVVRVYSIVQANSRIVRAVPVVVTGERHCPIKPDPYRSLEDGLF